CRRRQAGRSGSICWRQQIDVLPQEPAFGDFPRGEGSGFGGVVDVGEVDAGLVESVPGCGNGDYLRHFRRSPKVAFMVTTTCVMKAVVTPRGTTGPLPPEQKLRGPRGTAHATVCAIALLHSDVSRCSFA